MSDIDDAVYPVYVGEVTYARSRVKSDQQFSIFGPKAPDHPSVGRACAACRRKLAVGDMTTLLPLGPGDDREMQERMRAGRWFNAVTVEVHAACAGVEV